MEKLKQHFLFILLAAVTVYGIIYVSNIIRKPHMRVCDAFYEDRLAISIAQVSIIPNCFRQKRIVIQGFLSWENEGYYLYNDITDYEFSDYSKRLYLDLTKSEYKDLSATQIEVYPVRILIEGQVVAPMHLGKISTVKTLETSRTK